MIVSCVLAVGCAGHRESTRATPREERCIVRVSDRGTFVDGEPMSKADAVAYCKRAPGGAVVVAEAPESDVVEMKSALEREGIRTYVRRQLCDIPDCGRGIPAGPIQPRREIVVEPLLPKREIVGDPPK